MAMKATGTTNTFRTVIAVAVVVVGLAVTADRMTAASAGGSSAGGGAGGMGSAMVGQPVRTETVLNADSSPAVFGRAASARDAFGFPVGTKRTGKHVHDGLQSADYDEVVEIDGAGQPLAQTQFDSAGQLVSAVRFDSPPTFLTKVTKEAAAGSAIRGLSAFSATVAGEYEADDNPVMGGWDVHWDRSQDGIRVRGDETRVHLWADGRIQSVARVEHRLAASPRRPLAKDDAIRIVTGQFDRWFAGRGSGYSVQGIDLEWVAPNAAFDSGKLAAAGTPYRLAWVANVKPTGVAADYLALVTVYVDAGDGTVIGGDVVE